MHLEGSIDTYCEQMVSWKSRTADAGLDFGEGTTEQETYSHLDRLLEEFCQMTLNMSISQAKEHMVA